MSATKSTHVEVFVTCVARSDNHYATAKLLRKLARPLRAKASCTSSEEYAVKRAAQKLFGGPGPNLQAECYERSGRTTKWRVWR